MLSGYGAFDQDRDGRVSMEDLRKSMSDLELMMPLGELQVLCSALPSQPSPVLPSPALPCPALPCPAPPCPALHYSQLC